MVTAMSRDRTMNSLVSEIIAYEDGTMDPDAVVPFFQRMIDSRVIDSLQGSYQRTAQSLVDAGLCTVPKQITVRVIVDSGTGGDN